MDDQEKIVFVTPTRNYHYKVMLFGLKNVGATYQKMMTRMFEPLLGKNIKIYIDDMVAKSKTEFEYINDLRNIFEILRRHKLRLNASKCSFGVGSGKFLGYMVTHRGIKVNPTKSWQSTIYSHLGISKSLEADRDDCCSELIHLSVSRQV